MLARVDTFDAVLQAGVPMLSDGEFAHLQKLVWTHLGFRWDQGKKHLAYTRLAKRLALLDFRNFGEYCRFLDTPASVSERQALFDAVTTNHTQFFRERPQLDFLSKVLLSRWSRADKIRLWSAGCSTGQEPYTLAILLMEAFGSNRDIRILASDINSAALNTAQAGIYHAEELTTVPLALRQKYFRTESGRGTHLFHVLPALQAWIQFRMINFQDHRYPIKVPLDLIFFRNVMIYFSPEVQRTLIKRLRDHLRPGGLLCLGHSETIADMTGFKANRHNIFEKTSE